MIYQPPSASAPSSNQRLARFRWQDQTRGINGQTQLIEGVGHPAQDPDPTFLTETPARNLRCQWLNEDESFVFVALLYISLSPKKKMIALKSCIAPCTGSLLLVSFFWTSTLLSQQTEELNRDTDSTAVSTNAKIVAVTVSHTVAMVTRELDVPADAKPGVFDFGTLPKNVILESINGRSSEGLILESMQIREHGREQRELQLAALETERQRYEQEQLEASQGVVNIEKQIELLDRALESTKGKGEIAALRVSIDGQSLKSLLEFSLDKQSVLNQEKQKLDRRLEELESLIDEINYKARDLDYQSSRQYIAQVTVRNETQLPQKLSLSYLVRNCSWSPGYELFYDSENQTFRLRVIAMVSQETGEDWSGVRLHLTNDSLTRHNQKPILVPLQVQSIPSNESTSGLSDNDKVNARDQSENHSQYGDDIRKKWAEMSSGNSNSERNRRALLLQESELKSQLQKIALLADDGNDSHGDFCVQINRPATILSSPYEQSIEVSNGQLKGSLVHTATPLLSSFAYREVEFETGASQSLLEGSVRVYENDRLIGQSSLRPVQAGQPFSIGIGPDAKVRVRRELVKKNRETQGGNVREEQEVKLVLANYHDYAIRVHLFDRIPFSNNQQNAAIEYSAVNPPLSDDPLYRRTLLPRNILRWDLDIPATRFGANAFDHVYSFHVVHEKSSELNVAFRQVSGDLKELDELVRQIDTLSGGGMGGMGGGMGGMMRIGQ